MNLGRRIKDLRLKNNITQEQLAEKMRVTPQAVCKWENGKTMPDITLLPELSIFFGVTIDELFELTDDANFARIDNMLYKRNSLTDDEFLYAKDFLLKRKDNTEAVSRLARLYGNRADEYRAQSVKLARQVLDKVPNTSNVHSVLCGSLWDWDFSNHHELIGYYYQFIDKNPDITKAYEYLAELLIADLRLDEALEIVKKLDKIEHSPSINRILAKIEVRKACYNKAKLLWDEMTDEFPDSATAWSYKADGYAEIGLYDEAIEFYNKSAAMEKLPRYIDNNLSMAHIYEIKNDYKSTADEYEKIIDILITDHSVPEDGDVITEYRIKISECLSKL